ncbi:MAG: hypothetical protein HOO67_08090 [Candidatus Peribacteraceae bacterium]|nr:hypothetical protein [Candidatus Peribacteraceae bacterium]
MTITRRLLLSLLAFIFLFCVLLFLLSLAVHVSLIDDDLLILVPILSGPVLFMEFFLAGSKVLRERAAISFVVLLAICVPLEALFLFGMGPLGGEGGVSPVVILLPFPPALLLGFLTSLLVEYCSARILIFISCACFFLNLGILALLGFCFASNGSCMATAAMERGAGLCRFAYDSRYCFIELAARTNTCNSLSESDTATCVNVRESLKMFGLP